MTGELLIFLQSLSLSLFCVSIGMNLFYVHMRVELLMTLCLVAGKAKRRSREEKKNIKKV